MDQFKDNQGGLSRISLDFMEGAADHKDSFDGLQLKSNNPISLYSVIGNEKFAIQGFGPFSPEKEVVLGFDTDVHRENLQWELIRRKESLKIRKFT